MITTGLVLAVLAALLHVYIFTMESIAWTSARVRRTFGLTETQAIATKEMAFNQGFYNLFLAIAVFAGVVAFALGHQSVGAALVFAGIGSMTAAALVLFVSSPDKRKSAVTQGLLPLAATVVLAIGLAL